MYDNMDHSSVAKDMDMALLQNACRWQSFTSDYSAGSFKTDWTEEFCLFVYSRLAKLKKQGLLARACQGECPPQVDVCEQVAKIDRATAAARLLRR
jgi:hypothetical protein